MNVLSSTSLPRHVSLLGYGGLLPFIGLALLIPFSHDYRPLLAVALVNYGAVILSFVGALHWGFAMTAQDMSETGSSGVSSRRLSVGLPRYCQCHWVAWCWSSVLSSTSGRTGSCCGL